MYGYGGMWMYRGAKPLEVKCATCGGTGHVVVQKADGCNAIAHCPDCNGTGLASNPNARRIVAAVSIGVLILYALALSYLL